MMMMMAHFGNGAMLTKFWIHHSPKVHQDLVETFIWFLAGKGVFGKYTQSIQP